MQKPVPFLLALLLGLGLGAGAPTPGRAQDLDGVVSLSLEQGWRTAAGTQMTGLRISLAPGWKTYWRAPGDAGVPPVFDWAGSSNIADVTLHWPVPEVFELNGMRSIGYHEQVVIPLEFAATDPGAPIHVAGVVNLGICSDICVPVTLDFGAELEGPGAMNAAIAAALVDRPLTGAEAGLGRVICTAEAAAQGLRITARMELPPTGAPEAVVIEAGDPHVWVSVPEAWREGAVLVAVADVMRTDGQALALDRSALRLTVLGADMTVDVQGCTGG